MVLINMVVSRLESWFTKIEDGLTVAATILLFLMMVVLIINVIGRYIFNQSLPGATTFVTIYLMIGLVFLTGSRLQRTGGHVGVDLVYDKMSGKQQSAVNIISRIATMIIFIWISYLLTFEVIARFNRGATVGGLILFPTWVSYIFIPIGLGIFSLRLGIQISKDIVAIWRGEVQ